MDWNYIQPVEIRVKKNGIYDIPNILEEFGLNKGILICDSYFKKSGLADKIMENCKGKIFAIYSDITPNPKVEEIDACTNILREAKGDFAIGLGGGSAMDCAKAVCALVKTNDSIVSYHTGGKKFTEKSCPLIAIPTTAGTGSEVTPTAVLSDESKKVKSPISQNTMFPKLALIDSMLTVSLPKAVTASTGLDVLAHCLEAFWSKNHQPICDALAIGSAKQVFQYLQKAYDNGDNMDARDALCEASVIAGLAFGIPKTAASHGCSFNLTSNYGVPHGEACAFTLDSLININAKAENGRLEKFAVDVGFKDASAMADEVSRLKKYMGMKTQLKEIGVYEKDLTTFVKNCNHPLLNNNPVECTDELLEALFKNLL